LSDKYALKFHFCAFFRTIFAFAPDKTVNFAAF